MASIGFRSAIRADWPKLTPGVRFIDTINRSLPQNPPLPLPDVWGTLGFEVSSRAPVTMGRNPWVVERGIVTFIIVAKSGHGDAAGCTAATDLMHAWDGWTDPTGGYWLDRVGAPRHIDTEADGNWFLFAVPCEYQAQERVNLP